MTSWKLCCILRMLVEQRVGWQPTEPNNGIPWRAARQPPARYTDLYRSSSSGCSTSRGNCCFSRFFLDRPPGWGACPVGGVVHSRAVGLWLPWPAGAIQGTQTVRNRPPMQRQAPETMKPPGNQPGGGAPVSGQSCCPPRPALGKDVGGVRPPSGGGPYQRHEVQGRTWADDCPGPAILPAPAADQAGGPGS